MSISSKYDSVIVNTSNLFFKGIQQTRVYVVVVCVLAANVERLWENTRLF